MNSKHLIIKELFDLQFKLVNTIEIEYWSVYNKILKNINHILNEQNILCSLHLHSLNLALENFLKHNYILIDDFQYFKSLLKDLENHK